MAQFAISNRKTGIHEGGYANHPGDHGGETYRGIARQESPGDKWAGWAIIDHYKKTNPDDFATLLDSDAELPGLLVKFYHDNYWLPINGDAIPDQAIADHLYDVAVNSGPATAVKFLQTSLNLLNRNQQLYTDTVVDGKMGTDTIGTLATCLQKRGRDLLLKDLVFEQACNYRRIMLNDPTQEQFLVSWYARLDITVNP